MATSKFQKGPDLKRFMVRGGFLLLRRISWLPRVLITYFYFAQTLSLSLLFFFLSHTRARTHAATDRSNYSRRFSFLGLFIHQYRKPSQDKRLKLSLNGNRKIVGTLRGYDAFLNVVIEDAEGDGGAFLGQLVVRGNSIVQFEALERIY